MVYYFSGTGNSTFIATTIGNFLGLEQKFIPDLDPKDEKISSSRIIFVFPVYSWGVPPLVSEFIDRLGREYWEKVKESGIILDCIMTCGDEVALAPEMFIKSLQQYDIEVNSIWSVIMPNNYVLLPGFDVDSKNVEKQKLQSCEKRILEIAQCLERGEKRTDVIRGKFLYVKSKLIFPLFKRYGIYPKKWKFNNNCIGCGRCKKICPLMNVSMIENHPMWGNKCCSCLGCYHICPVHAVEYGKETIKKGQYIFPLKKIANKNFHE